MKFHSLKVIVTSFFVSFFLNVQSQTILDSLQNILNKTTDDTIRVNVLNEITKQYLNTAGYLQALPYVEQALKKSQRIGYRKGIATSSERIGLIFQYVGNYEKALNNYLTALKHWEEIENTQKVINSYYSIADIYQIQGNYQKQLAIYLKIVKIEESRGDKDKIANSYGSIAGAYLNQCREAIKDRDTILANLNYEKIIDYDLKALKIWETENNKDGIASMLSVLAFIYDKLNLCQESKIISESNLIQSDYSQESKNNYLKALKIYEELKNTDGILTSYYNLGVFYKNQGNLSFAEGNLSEANLNYETALKNYFLGLQMIEQRGYKHGMANSYKEIGTVFLKLEKFTEASNYLNKAANVFNGIGYKVGMKESYSQLSNLFEKKNDYKQAFEYYKMYSDIKDSLLNEANLKQMSEMNVKYETEKKEKENAILKTENQVKAREVDKQRFLKIFFVVIILFLSVIIFIFINRKHKLIQLAQKNKLRKDISHDLHDEIGSGLTKISMICEGGKALLRKQMPLDSALLNTISSESRVVSENLNSIVWSTNPDNDNLNSLISNFRTHTLKFFEGSPIQCKITLPEEVNSISTNPNVNRNLFLILKESLNNCAKHSKADSIIIDFSIEKNKNYILKIRDNGIGFDLENIPLHRNGMKSLKNRVSEINAVINLKSEINMGTVIEISGRLI